MVESIQSHVDSMCTAFIRRESEVRYQTLYVAPVVFSCPRCGLLDAIAFVPVPYRELVVTRGTLDACIASAHHAHSPRCRKKSFRCLRLPVTMDVLVGRVQ